MTAETPTYKYKLSEKDLYETPAHVYLYLKDLIPKNKIVWDPFPGSGRSRTIMKAMGLKVYEDDLKQDFFTMKPPDGVIIVTNPPFSIKRLVIRQIQKLGLSWFLLLPQAALNTALKDCACGMVPIRKQIKFINGDEMCARPFSVYCAWFSDLLKGKLITRNDYSLFAQRYEYYTNYTEDKMSRSMENNFLFKLKSLQDGKHY